MKESLFIKTFMISFKHKLWLGFNQFVISNTGNYTVISDIITKNPAAAVGSINRNESVHSGLKVLFLMSTFLFLFPELHFFLVFLSHLFFSSSNVHICISPFVLSCIVEFLYLLSFPNFPLTLISLSVL